MAQNDQIKWDKKYKETPQLLQQRDPSEKLMNILKHVKGKNALDVACGAGKNALFLANNDFHVDALDISQVALEALDKKGIPNIKTQHIDLETFVPPANHYDLIVKTNYLQRDIIMHLSHALKTDGLLFIETYMHHDENEKPPSNPDFLLKQGELKSFFDEKFEILDYEEFFNETYELYRMRKQSITVRKR